MQYIYFFVIIILTIFKVDSGYAKKISQEELTADSVIVRVQKGETLIDVLLAVGLQREDVMSALEELGNVYDPNTLDVGQNIIIHFSIQGDGANEKLDFISMHIFTSDGKEVVVRKFDDFLFMASVLTLPSFSKLVHHNIAIEHTLFSDARQAGIPVKLILELIKIYSYDVDFQRDIHKGDRLEVVYEEPSNQRVNDTIAASHPVYANLILRQRHLPAYRFQTADGQVAYYDDKGNSLQKALLKTPIDGARISSGYGRRKHPILGYTKWHRGVDFSAVRGTPVYAAGDGVVVRQQRFGSYGNYIKVHHANGFETAYAHLDRFAKGLRNGQRVRQGQVIGYVGSTGRATGPHLHFEMLRDGDYTNPLSVQMASGKKLSSLALGIFYQYRRHLAVALAGKMVLGKQFAMAEADDDEADVY